MSNLIVTLTGPSGSGKTELLNLLCATGRYEKIRSCATRPMRPGEIDGQDYIFVSRDHFQTEADRGKFIQSVSFQGNFYGTHEDEMKRVIQAGKTPIIIVEPTGIEQFALGGYAVYPIFITADHEVLLSRYLARLNSGDIMDEGRRNYHAKRLAGIMTEVTKWPNKFPYSHSLDNSTDEIGNLDKMKEYLDHMIQGAILEGTWRPK